MNRKELLIMEITNKCIADIEKTISNWNTLINATSTEMNELAKVYNNTVVQQQREIKLKELDKVGAKFDETFNGFIKQYINTHPVPDFANDGKDHALDIANALKVIDILGCGLDVDNLNNIIAPLLKDYKSIKYICDVILTRHHDSSIKTYGNAAYKEEVIDLIVTNYLVDPVYSEYVNCVQNLINIINSGKKFKYTVVNLTSVSNGVTANPVTVSANLSYEVQCISNDLKKAVELYADLKKSKYFNCEEKKTAEEIKSI